MMPSVKWLPVVIPAQDMGLYTPTTRSPRPWPASARWPSSGHPRCIVPLRVTPFFVAEYVLTADTDGYT